MTELDDLAVQGTPLAADLRARRARPDDALAEPARLQPRPRPTRLVSLGKTSVIGRSALSQGPRRDQAAAASPRRSPSRSPTTSRSSSRDIDDPKRAVEIDARAARDTRPEGADRLHRHGGPPQLRSTTRRVRSTSTTRSATSCTSRSSRSAPGPAPTTTRASTTTTVGGPQRRRLRRRRPPTSARPTAASPGSATNQPGINQPLDRAALRPVGLPGRLDRYGLCDPAGTRGGRGRHQGHEEADRPVDGSRRRHRPGQPRRQRPGRPGRRPRHRRRPTGYPTAPTVPTGARTARDSRPGILGSRAAATAANNDLLGYPVRQLMPAATPARGTRGRRARSLASSPTMVGAITTLIVIVAVFLAYNANNGLPFVPVYRVSVIVPNASRLVPNNEVRIGGTRVGVVESIDAGPARRRRRRRDSDDRARRRRRQHRRRRRPAQPEARQVGVADPRELDLPDPLPAPRSASSTSRSPAATGRRRPRASPSTGPTTTTIPPTTTTRSSRSTRSQKNEGADDGTFIAQTEFDEIGNTFDQPTRNAIRQNLAGYGDALRGPRRLAQPGDRGAQPAAHQPASRSPRRSNDPRHEPRTPSSRRSPGPRRSSPRSPTQNAELFGNMATTFAAIGGRPRGAAGRRSRAARRRCRPGSTLLPAQQPFLSRVRRARAAPAARASRTCASRCRA